MNRTFSHFARCLAGSVTATALLALSAPAEAETLGNALVSAYKTSDLLDQNQALLRAADEDVAGAVSALRPVVAWILQSEWSDGGPQGEITTNQVGLSLDWTVYDFGRNRLGIDIARETVLATRQALVGIEQNVLLAAVQAYMDVRRAADQVGINENSVRVIGEELRAAQDRFEVGEITRTDVALAEARLAAGRAALAAAQGDLDVARASYKAAVGHLPDRIEGIPPTPALPGSMEEAQSIALRLHPTIRQAQHQAKVADLQIEAAAAQRRPTIGAELRTATDDEGDNSGSASLQLSQTIYAGGRLSAA
jgi:outer membrane protein